jgi:hypothetical protein
MHAEIEKLKKKLRRKEEENHTLIQKLASMHEPQYFE